MSPLLVAGALGFGLGLIACFFIVRERINDLRAALGGLVRACEGDTCTLQSASINKALIRAHRVLEGRDVEA